MDEVLFLVTPFISWPDFVRVSGSCSKNRKVCKDGQTLMAWSGRIRDTFLGPVCCASDVSGMAQAFIQSVQSASVELDLRLDLTVNTLSALLSAIYEQDGRMRGRSYHSGKNNNTVTHAGTALSSDQVVSFRVLNALHRAYNLICCSKIPGSKAPSSSVFSQRGRSQRDYQPPRTSYDLSCWPSPRHSPEFQHIKMSSMALSRFWSIVQFFGRYFDPIALSSHIIIVDDNENNDNNVEGHKKDPDPLALLLFLFVLRFRVQYVGAEIDHVSRHILHTVLQRYRMKHGVGSKVKYSSASASSTATSTSDAAAAAAGIEADASHGHERATYGKEDMLNEDNINVTNNISMPPAAAPPLTYTFSYATWGQHNTSTAHTLGYRLRDIPVSHQCSMQRLAAYVLQLQPAAIAIAAATASLVVDEDSTHMEDDRDDDEDDAAASAAVADGNGSSHDDVLRASSLRGSPLPMGPPRISYPPSSLSSSYSVSPPSVAADSLAPPPSVRANATLETSTIHRKNNEQQQQQHLQWEQKVPSPRGGYIYDYGLVPLAVHCTVEEFQARNAAASVAFPEAAEFMDTVRKKASRPSISGVVEPSLSYTRKP